MMLDTVDLRACKQVVLDKLPPGHPVRDAILAEPDALPLEAARVKLQALGAMLVRQGA